MQRGRRAFRSVTWFCLCLAALCLAGLGARAELRAGAAKVSITPDVKTRAIPLGGYAARRGAPATGVHDTIFARAMALSNGAEKIYVVSVDLCFLPSNVKREVMRRLPALGVGKSDAARLLISATHTHSAPDPLAMHTGNTFALKGWSPFDRRLLDETATGIAWAIAQADKRMVPARLATGLISGAGRNRNRRGETLTDPTMTLLKVTALNGQPIAAVVNYAAHPVLYGDAMRDISADWPGVMTSDVERALGGSAVCLFLNGAEGDASPNGAQGVTEGERVADYGHTLSKLALQGLETVRAAPNPKIAAWTQIVTLPPRKPNALFILAAAQLGASVAQAKQFVLGLMPTTAPLSFARIGPLLLLGFPCEPTAQVGLAAKDRARKAGFALPAVVALTNEWLAYALAPAQYREGKYEAAMSFYGDQLGPTLLKGISAGLEKKR